MKSEWELLRKSEPLAQEEFIRLAKWRNVQIEEMEATKPSVVRNQILDIISNKLGAEIYNYNPSYFPKGTTLSEFLKNTALPEYAC